MFSKKIKAKNKLNTSRSGRLLMRPLVLLLLALSLAVGSVPFLPNNANASGALEPHISQVLAKNALATCIAYSPLRDDKSWFDVRSNINESNAAALKWFSDSPSGSNSIPLDVFAGAGLKHYAGFTSVDAYGRAQCSNPTFIKESLTLLGYNVQAGSADNVYPIMCELGFRRDKGTDECASGKGSWDRRSLGTGDSARDKVLAVDKLSKIAALTDAEKYWLGYTSFEKLCDATITAPGTATITQGVTTIKKYNGDVENPQMVDMVAKWGSNVKSLSGALGNDMYTVGTTTKTTTNFPPGVSAGGVIAGSVRIGALSNGCVAFANSVNSFADAYLAWVKKNPDKAAVETGTAIAPGTPDGDNSTSCAIEGVGWIVCPATLFLANIGDFAFTFLANNFLKVDIGIISTSSGTYTAWATMRTVANILFVIAFLIIIFSQLTGQGIANYGIKKMLPRLIVAAVLVNVSFFICQIAVDLSNLLGFGLKQLFVTIGGPINSSIAYTGDESGNWVGITTLVLAGGAVAWALGISVLLPFLLATVVALLMVLLILVIRQVLIVLLVVVAPIAFVAYLLPNTEQWFTKWRKMFVGLLLVFPLIGLLFGAAELASDVLKSVYAGTDDTIGKIIAVGVLAIPLFLLPSLLKNSLNAAGNIGAKINGISSKLTKGTRSGVANNGAIKSLANRKAEKRAAIKTGTYGGRNPISRLRSSMNRGVNNAGWFNAATAGYGADRTLQGQTQQRKDAQEAMAMFGGDDGLVEAWAASGGNLDKAKAQFKLSDAQVQQFKLMQNAGHSRKPTSFLAAAQYLSENGKGSGTVVQQALDQAKSAGASDIQVGGAAAAAVAAYRKSGRGDALAQLSTSAGIKPMSMEEGWSQVAAAAVHRDGITQTKDPTTGVVTKSSGLVAYEKYLAAKSEHTRQALAGYDSMEARARESAQASILEAAQIHQYSATGVAPTITTIQDAKVYFNVK